MLRLRILVFAAAMLTLRMSTTPVRAEMIQWKVAQVSDPGYFPAYTIFPPHIGGIDPPGITGRLDFGDPYLLPHAGSMVVPVQPIALRGSGFFADGSSGAWGMVIGDSASGQSGIAQFGISASGAFDTSTQRSTVRVSARGAGPDKVSLGQNTYAVTLHISPILWNPAPGHRDFEGTIYADVRVSPTNAVGTPEPTSLVAACMGLLTISGAVIGRVRSKGYRLA
jgi:hypothetical protein